MPFDVAFERDILAKAAVDPVYRESARRLLDEHSFTASQHGWLWKVIAKLSYTDRLTGHVALARAKKDIKDEEERGEHLRVALQILRHEPGSAAASLKELGDFLLYQHLSSGIEKAIRAMDGGKVDEASESLREAIRFRPQTQYESVDWIEGFEERQKDRKELSEHPERRLVIPTRLKKLDGLLSGGIEVSELGLIVATTNRGKSSTAVHLSFWAAAQGFNTTYISTEMGIDPVATRHDTKLLGLPYSKIKQYQFDKDELEEAEARVDRLRSRLEKRLRIVATPLRRASIATVEQVLDDLEAEGRTTQLLVMDSGDHLQPSQKHREFRLEQANVYWDLKSLAGERGMACWCTTHAPKEVVNKIATAENTAEAYDKARIADIIFTLNQTKADERSDRLTGYLAKNRQGRAKVLIPLIADFAHMHIEEAEPEEEPEEEREEEREDGD